MGKLTFDELPNVVADLVAQIEELSRIINAQQNNTGDRKKPIGREEAAAYLNMSKSSLYRLVNNREVPHYKKGSLYFLKDELDAWVREGKVQTMSDAKKEAIESVAKRMK